MSGWAARVTPPAALVPLDLGRESGRSRSSAHRRDARRVAAASNLFPRAAMAARRTSSPSSSQTGIRAQETSSFLRQLARERPAQGLGRCDARGWPFSGMVTSMPEGLAPLCAPFARIERAALGPAGRNPGTGDFVRYSLGRFSPTHPPHAPSTLAFLGLQLGATPAPSRAASPARLGRTLCASSRQSAWVTSIWTFLARRSPPRRADGPGAAKGSRAPHGSRDRLRGDFTRTSRPSTPAGWPRAHPAEAPRLGAWLSPPFGEGSLGGDYTCDEVGLGARPDAAAYPATGDAALQSIGTSLEGRGSGRSSSPTTRPSTRASPRCASTPCTTPASRRACSRRCGRSCGWSRATAPTRSRPAIVDEREIWFVPVVNPDGYVYNQQHRTRRRRPVAQEPPQQRCPQWLKTSAGFLRRQDRPCSSKLNRGSGSQERRLDRTPKSSVGPVPRQSHHAGGRRVARSAGLCRLAHVEGIRAKRPDRRSADDRRRKGRLLSAYRLDCDL